MAASPSAGLGGKPPSQGVILGTKLAYSYIILRRLVACSSRTMCDCFITGAIY